jgi:hypothetical protein
LRFKKFKSQQKCEKTMDIERIKPKTS